MKDIREYIRYCPDTGQMFWLKSPKFSISVGDLVGSNHSQGYKQTKFNGVGILLHRLAWYLYYKQWPTSDIDHINGDRSDNRIGNLRLATRRQNIRNARGRNKTSQYKGVSWDKSREKWSAYIKFEDKVKNLGRFNCEKEAAMMYDKWAKEKFGEFAYLNFHPALSEEAIMV